MSFLGDNTKMGVVWLRSEKTRGAAVNDEREGLTFRDDGGLREKALRVGFTSGFYLRVFVILI